MGPVEEGGWAASLQASLWWVGGGAPQPNLGTEVRGAALGAHRGTVAGALGHRTALGPCSPATLQGGKKQQRCWPSAPFPED